MHDLQLGAEVEVRAHFRKATLTLEFDSGEQVRRDSVGWTPCKVDCYKRLI